jgi:hypothetical protein
MLNATPILSRMFNSKNVDHLIFPVTTWASTDIPHRRAYIADALGDADALARTWSPPVVSGPKPQIGTSNVVVPYSDDMYRHSLYLVRDQMEMIERMRSGITHPQFPFPFTPRFVSELSSLLVQCASVQQTYGVKEMDLFMTELAADGSLYARFFSSIVLLLSGRTRLPEDAVVVVNSRDVDWRALGVAVTWCFCGSSQNPEFLSPVNRMAALLQALQEDDRQALFPPAASFRDLLNHLDIYFEVEPAEKAAERNSAALRGFFDRASAKLATAGEIAHELSSILEIFGALLGERERVVTQIFGDIEGYTDVGRYVRALPHWPQCPVSMDFRPAGIVVYRDVLERLGADPVISDTYDDQGKLIEDATVEVSYQSFLPGGSAFPWRVARGLADHRDLFDMFFDPQQIDVEREHQIRRLIAEVHGKDLIRFIH